MAVALSSVFCQYSPQEVLSAKGKVMPEKKIETTSVQYFSPQLRELLLPSVSEF